jgi:hypothetical protein
VVVFAVALVVGLSLLAISLLRLGRGRRLAAQVRELQ